MDEDERLVREAGESEQGVDFGLRPSRAVQNDDQIGGVRLEELFVKRVIVGWVGADEVLAEGGIMPHLLKGIADLAALPILNAVARGGAPDQDSERVATGGVSMLLVATPLSSARRSDF